MIDYSQRVPLPALLTPAAGARPPSCILVAAGFITFKDLKRVAKELGENLTDEEIQEVRAHGWARAAGQAAAGCSRACARVEAGHTCGARSTTTLLAHSTVVALLACVAAADDRRG